MLYWPSCLLHSVRFVRRNCLLYEAELDRFKDFDAEVVSISMDSTHALNAWSKSMSTSFPLLSDFYPQGSVVDLYGLRNPLGNVNCAVIIIDKEGIIRFIRGAGYSW